MQTLLSVCVIVFALNYRIWFPAPIPQLKDLSLRLRRHWVLRLLKLLPVATSFNSETSHSDQAISFRRFVSPIPR
jgi:hypothetical protein